MTKIIGGTIPPKEHKKLKVEDAVDRVLERLIFAKMETASRAERTEWRQDCMFRPEDMGPMWSLDALESFIDDFGIFHPDEIDDPRVSWPISFGVVMGSYAQEVRCSYAQTVAAKELRGKCRVVGKYNAALYHGLLGPDGKFVSVVDFCSWLGRRWVYSGFMKYDQALLKAVRETGGAPRAAYRMDGGVEKGETPIGETLATSQSMALSCRYIWGAQFSIENSARVIIPCTPDGVRELFDDRDRPAEADRRAPLRHWVRQHMRRRGKQHDFTAVRRHLRGATKLKWRGYDVVVRPSEFDQDQNEAARLAKEARKG